KIKYKNLEIENSEEGLIIYSKGINFSPSDLKIEYENLTKEVKEKEIIFNFDNEKLLKFNFENGFIKISAFNKKEIRYEVLNEKDLSQTPNWTADPTNQADARFGFSVSTAGDVNGDGYMDVIIGAPLFDNQATNEGRAYVYHGSSGGLSQAPNWTADPTNQEDALFGYSVSTAGDVNGDGYSDVIIGAHWFDNQATSEGRAYVYLGS
ncbi:MAG: integrin alpha, partial [Candidatus Hydrothermales bacterium]